MFHGAVPPFTSSRAAEEARVPDDAGVAAEGEGARGRTRHRSRHGVARQGAVEGAFALELEVNAAALVDLHLLEGDGVVALAVRAGPSARCRVELDEDGGAQAVVEQVTLPVASGIDPGLRTGREGVRTRREARAAGSQGQRDDQ